MDLGLSWEGLAALLVLLAVVITRGVAAVGGGWGCWAVFIGQHCQRGFLAA